MRIWRNDFGSESSLQREFREVGDGLSSAEVNASENATAAMQGIPGGYGSYDDTRINCRDAPPRRPGERGESVETFVAVDGYTYYVRLTRIERIAGNTFENVTAP